MTNSADTPTVKGELADEAPQSLTWPPAVEVLEDDAYTELVERVMDEANTSDFDHFSPEDLVDDLLDNVPRAFIDAALEEVWPTDVERRLDPLGLPLCPRPIARSYVAAATAAFTSQRHAPYGGCDWLGSPMWSRRPT